MVKVLGPDCGANFHSWAVWGSKKAGVTIRQEDLGQALRDATGAGGISGLVSGFMVARAVGGGWLIPLGMVTGTISGAWSGRRLAYWSRDRAARLILEGNRLVLDDIGRVTARFCDTFQSSEDLTEARLSEFTQTVGKTHELLGRAFTHYGLGALETERRRKHQHVYFANLLAILHEHRKLQPYISQSLPFIVSRCVTQRLMCFEIGALRLAVSEEVPPLAGMRAFPETLDPIDLYELKELLVTWEATPSKGVKAQDWTHLDQRMAYIVSLFRRYHLDESVMASAHGHPASAGRQSHSQNGL